MLRLVDGILDMRVTERMLSAAADYLPDRLTLTAEIYENPFRPAWPSSL